MTGLRVAVVGAAGYVGGELLRVLDAHPDVASVEAVSRTHPGRAWGEVHPGFRFERDRVFSGDDAQAVSARSDVVFLALGHGESSQIMPALLESGDALVIDLGADFRLDDPDTYRRFYGEHPCFALCEGFVYGLPERNRAAIRNARRVANPGCMATASELALLPAAAKGWLGNHPAVFAVTGSSGSGQSLKATTHHPFRAANLFVYKPLTHQHEAEIARVLSAAAGRPTWARMIAHSGPFVRGIHATTLLAGPAIESANVAAAYRAFYADEPFVRVLDAPPDVASVAGTNFAYLHVAQSGDEALVTCVIDNLMKGAAGQAVQNMNLALGLPESAGLRSSGFFPY